LGGTEDRRILQSLGVHLDTLLKIFTQLPLDCCSDFGQTRSTDFRHKHSSHSFYIAETPKITHLTSANASYNEGSPVNISCKATGTPDPDVKWIHNGQVKSSGVKTAHVTFSKMSKEDSGMFTCSANNSAGITEKQIYLIVKCEYTHFLQAILKKETKINQKYKV